MKNNGKWFSIKTKMYIFVILTVLIVAFGTSMTAFITSAGQINSYYKQCAADNARNFATFVDAGFIAQLREAAESEEYQQLRDRAEAEDNEQLIEDYLKEKGLWEKYNETRRLITDYLENMEGIKYIYLVAPGDAYADHDMYLVDEMSIPIYETGYYEEREAELRGVDITALPEPTISNGDWGWLCSDFKPVYTTDGRCICIVGCDIEMDDVMYERKQLMIYLIVGSLILAAVVLTGAMLFINRIVVKPLDAMTKEMKNFTPAEGVSYEDAGLIELDIKSHDEINEIYQGIRAMQKNTIDHLNDLSALQQDKLKAEKDIEDKERQIGQLSLETYRDTLTGVGNKAAYAKKAEEINRSLADGPVEFALVMVDMNNLKQINDDHGHKSGDMYIKGCCHMVCEAFKHSPVYRIGGDEFVVILQGADYNDRKDIFHKLKTGFEECYSNEELDPWMRYSAAVGMAEHASDDNTIDFVFKRADKSMYEDKMRFKKEHGGYR